MTSTKYMERYKEPDIEISSPYKFSDNVNLALYESCSIISEEVYNIQSFNYESENLIVETILNGDTMKAEVLTEAVIGFVASAACNFVKKILQILTSVREKISAFFYNLAGKTDKWLEVMKPKIEKNRNAPGVRDLEYSMFDREKLKNINGFIFDASYIITEFKDISNALKNIKRSKKSINNDNASDIVIDRIKSGGTEMTKDDSASDMSEKMMKTVLEKYYTNLKKFSIDIDTNDGIQGIITALKEYLNDTDNYTTEGTAENIDVLLDIVSSHKKANIEMEKIHKNAVRALKDVYSDISAFNRDIKKINEDSTDNNNNNNNKSDDNNKQQSENNNSQNTSNDKPKDDSNNNSNDKPNNNGDKNSNPVVSNYMSALTAVIGKLITLENGICETSLSFLNKQVSIAMKALTKVANLKPEKEEK